MNLERKRILLSGASGGLGQAIAEQLAGAGAVLVLSSRRAEQLGELAKRLPGGVERHSVVVADLAERGAPERLIGEAGELHGLVAGAGISSSGRLTGYSQEQLSRALRINLEAPMALARELVPSLLERGEGHIVFVSSLNGRAATPRTSLYCATKFGLRGFALALREDLVPAGVGVSLVSPGLVRDAGMFHDSGAKAPAEIGSTTPEKVGKAVVKAIRRNRAEILVAPWRQRRLSNIATRHPELAGRLTRGGRAAQIADEVAAAHADKR